MDFKGRHLGLWASWALSWLHPSPLQNPMAGVGSPSKRRDTFFQTDKTITSSTLSIVKILLTCSSIQLFLFIPVAAIIVHTFIILLLDYQSILLLSAFILNLPQPILFCLIIFWPEHCCEHIVFLLKALQNFGGVSNSQYGIQNLLIKLLLFPNQLLYLANIPILQAHHVFFHPKLVLESQNLSGWKSP